MEEIIRTLTVLIAFPFPLLLPLKISPFLKLKDKFSRTEVMSYCAFKQAVLPVLSY